MHQRGYFKHLVFQGETCLRLIYGSNRFSEDLDFVGGVDFDQSVVDGLADTISSYLTARYGLSVRVKAPKKKRKVRVASM
ncbi:nucleotidyl transferase AbiEii/AbiGii toxin family protein [Jhaorihella thermophila]